MIVIYHCYGGTHSSVVAAAIHTNKLPLNRLPTTTELKNLPFYDKVPPELIGTPFFYGTDKKNNRIYFLGMKKAENLNKRVIYSLLKIENIPSEKILLINTLKYINIWVRIGGFFSRRLGIIKPGRNLTIYGIKKNYNKFVDLVKNTRNKIGIAES